MVTFITRRKIELESPFRIRNSLYFCKIIRISNNFVTAPLLGNLIV
jgi:hypothetical protein